MKKEYTGKRTVQGVITVEMSYLIPLILLLFLWIVYTVFYYHDKNILLGAASETAVLGTQLERNAGKTQQADLEEFYRERVRGKLLLFSEVQVSAVVTEAWAEVEVSAIKGKMQVRVMQRALLMEPEKKIRRKRIWEGIVSPEYEGTEEDREVEENASGGI